MVRKRTKKAELDKPEEVKLSPSSFGVFGEQLNELTKNFAKEAKGIAEKHGVALEVVVRFGITKNPTQGE